MIKKVAMLAAVAILLMSTKVQAAEFQTAKATAYCLTGETASGTYTTEGRTVASSKRNIGKMIDIWIDEGDHIPRPENFLGAYICEDRGGKPIEQEYVFDIYMTDYDRCIEFGCKNIIYLLVEREERNG